MSEKLLESQDEEQGIKQNLLEKDFPVQSQSQLQIQQQQQVQEQQDQQEEVSKSSFLSALCNTLLFILFFPLILIFFLLYFLLWIFPFFGYCYEKSTEKQLRIVYSPSSEDLLQWSGSKQTRQRNLHAIVRVKGEVDLQKPPLIILNGLAATLGILEPLINSILEFVDPGTQVFALGIPGTGFSEPEDEDVIFQPSWYIDVYQFAIKQRGLKPPFILLGLSFGGTIAQLYRLLHPQEILGVVLIDPSPDSIFQGPMGKDLTKAPEIYNTMSSWAKAGIFRPLTGLMKKIPGELGEIFQQMPDSYTKFFLTSLHCKTVSREFVGMALVTAQLFEEHQKFHRNTNSNNKNNIYNTPLTLVSALNWSKPETHSGYNKKKLREWWVEAQDTFLKTSNKTNYLPFINKTHPQIMMNYDLIADSVCKMYQNIHLKQNEQN